MTQELLDWETGWMWSCYPRWGMLENKAVWGELSEFTFGHFKCGRMLFVHFLNMEHKRLPPLSWIPCLKKNKKAIRDSCSQAIEGPKYRTWNFMYRKDLKIHMA